MRHFFFIILFLFCFAATAAAGDGMINLKSPHSVADTADHLENILKEKGMTVFTRIDHSKGAQKAGLALKPTELVIFGNPKVGTPLMHCARTVALDLPQKALIRQDDTGQVWLTYNDPGYLAERHGITDCNDLIAKIEKVLANIAAAATAAE